MGDILGGGSSNNNYEIRGTVDSVDMSSRSIYLTNVSGYNSSMLSSGGNSVRVYYDDQTTVSYNGRSYRPQDLERGDQISATVDQSGNNLVANDVTVLQDVNTSSGSSSGGVYGSSFTGTVRSIDTSRRRIEVDRGYGSTMWVEYETSTPVYYGGQTYRASDLERGDQIDVRFTDLGSGRYLARDITVTRSISGNSSSSSNLSTVRGTVRYVDTSRRTIELESASWINGFTTGGSTGSTVIVQYDTNSSVDVSGRAYPVSGLERGDVVEVQVANAGSSTPFAQRIYLVRDVNNNLR